MRRARKESEGSWRALLHRPTVPCRRGQRQPAWSPRTPRARAAQQTTDEDEKTASRFHLELVEKSSQVVGWHNQGGFSLATLTQCLQDVMVTNEVRAPKSLQTFLADAHLKTPTGVPPGSEALGDVTEFMRQWPFPNSAHVDVDVLHPITVDMTTIEKMQLLTKGLISDLLLPKIAEDAEGAEQVHATCGQFLDLLQEGTSGDAEVPDEGLKVLEVAGVVATFDVLRKRRHGEARGSH